MINEKIKLFLLAFKNMNTQDIHEKMAKMRQAKEEKAKARRKLADLMKERRLEAAKTNEARKSAALNKSIYGDMGKCQR